MYEKGRRAVIHARSTVGICDHPFALMFMFAIILMRPHSYCGHPSAHCVHVLGRSFVRSSCPAFILVARSCVRSSFLSGHPFIGHLCVHQCALRGARRSSKHFHIRMATIRAVIFSMRSSSRDRSLVFACSHACACADIIAFICSQPYARIHMIAVICSHSYDSIHTLAFKRFHP